MAHKEDVEILLELYKDLLELYKSQGKQIDNILSIMEGNHETIRAINDNTKQILNFIDRQKRLTIELSDELNDLKKRVYELETQVKADKGSC